MSRLWLRSALRGNDSYGRSRSPTTGFTGDLADESADSFDRVTAINQRGVWTCMKHELRQMRSEDGGAIVNCSSLGGLVGQAGRATYHATKHGVIGLTKSAAMDYARSASGSTRSAPA